MKPFKVYFMNTITYFTNNKVNSHFKEVVMHVRIPENSDMVNTHDDNVIDGPILGYNPR